ncbi:MAG: hypothetical protein K8S87_04375 [Planctomycetes bacterium]|nr:hypothetical protein [Planctomycetota bacterium]
MMKKAIVGIKSGLDLMDKKLLYSSQKQPMEKKAESEIAISNEKLTPDTDVNKASRDTEDEIDLGELINELNIKLEEKEIEKAKPVSQISDKRPVSGISDRSKLPERRTEIYKKKRSKLPGIIGIVLILVVIAVTVLFILAQEGVTTPGDVLKNVGTIVKGKEGQIVGTWLNKKSKSNAIIKFYENKRYYLMKEGAILDKIQGKWEISENTLFLEADTIIFGDITINYEIVKLDNKILVLKDENNLVEYERISTEDNISDEKLRKFLLQENEVKNEPEYFPISRLETVSLEKWEDMWERRINYLDNMENCDIATIEIEDRRNQFDILFKKYAISVIGKVVDVEYAKTYFSNKKEGLIIKFALEVNGFEKNWKNDNWFDPLYVKVPESKRNTLVKGTRWQLLIRLKGKRCLKYTGSYSPLEIDKDVLIEPID